jgi:hypothetical protein
MALVPAALFAQAPAPAPAPTPAPAAAPAQLTFTQTLKANKPAIEQLLKEFHPEDALAKAEALLPTAAPEFNGIDLRTASASSFQFSDLSRIYHLAAKCAMTDGLWEKGQVYLGKAKETAQSNYDHTAAAYKSSIETWTTAMATANKALTDGAGRIKELEAKQKPLTPEEETELKGLQPKKPADATPRFQELNGRKEGLNPNEKIELQNFQTHRTNVANGTRVIKSLEGDLKALQSEVAAYSNIVDKNAKTLADEKEELDKKVVDKPFKGDRQKLLIAMLGPKNLEDRTTKDLKLNWLNRLRFLCADSPQAAKVQEVIDRVRADQDPFPPQPKGKKKKQS